jgi:hypothetical protein
MNKDSVQNPRDFDSPGYCTIPKTVIRLIIRGHRGEAKIVLLLPLLDIAVRGEILKRILLVAGETTASGVQMIQ